MANFLKIVSGLYLLLVWVGFVATVALAPAPEVYSGPLALLIALGASIPAAVLFAFAQIVEDVRSMRNNLRLQSDHLKAMRNYYEPQARWARLISAVEPLNRPIGNEQARPAVWQRVGLLRGHAGPG